MVSLKDKIAKLNGELGFLKLADCNDEKNYSIFKTMYDEKQELPPDIIVESNDDGVRFYRVSISEEISETDKDTYLKIFNANNINKITNDIHTIKNCAIFFTVLAIIGLVGGFIINFM